MNNDERRERNRRILNETLDYIHSDEYLSASVRTSMDHLEFFPSEKIVECERGKFEHPATVVVSRKRTASALYESGYGSVMLLDFASATSPGGGVRKGSNAQEVSLCRVSTLLLSLESRKARPFYERHRKSGDAYYSDSLLLVPDVVFFRSDDESAEILARKKWRKASVIVSAAPNLRRIGEWECFSNEEKERYFELMRSRVDSVFRAAAKKGADHLILGAFGCGAFKNPAGIAAGIFRDVQQDYLRSFKVIEYAIGGGNEWDENHQAFRRALS